jgi:hypothetical protein
MSAQHVAAVSAPISLEQAVTLQTSAASECCPYPPAATPPSLPNQCAVDAQSTRLRVPPSVAAHLAPQAQQDRDERRLIDPSAPRSHQGAAADPRDPTLRAPSHREWPRYTLPSADYQQAQEARTDRVDDHQWHDEQ